MLARTWQAPAKYDSRKRHYRCRCCSKVIAACEEAIFTRMSPSSLWVQRNGNRIWAIHAACGDVRHSESYTWREVMEHWANR